MGFSKHLRNALRQYVFEPPVYGNECNNPSWSTQAPSAPQPPYNTPYTDKINDGYTDGFNYDTDMPESYEYHHSVTFGILSVANSNFRNHITNEEFAELRTFMTDETNHKCELRIIVQNQRATNRYNSRGGAQYPSGQTTGVYTPGDLSDVATILGYRGNDNVNYGNAMQTGPETTGPGTTSNPGEGYRKTGDVYGECGVNNLNNQPAHHPSNTNHPVLPGKFTAGGMPAIVEPGNNHIMQTNGTGIGSRLQIPTILGAPNRSITIGFPTAGNRYTMNYNSMFFYDEMGAQHEGNLCSPTGGPGYGDIGHDTAPTLEFKLGTTGTSGNHWCIGVYQYKFPITGDTLSSQYVTKFCDNINYPIIYKAMKVLGRRNYTTFNTYIPDSFNYTVGLVFYTKKSGTSHRHGEVYDIIFDRLRVIDRYDIDAFISAGDGGDFLHHKHPSIQIRRGSTGTASGDNRYYATFANVPKEGVQKHFINPSGSILLGGGIGNEQNLKSDSIPLLERLVGVCSISTSYMRSIRFDSFIVNSTLGTSLSAGYSTSNESLTVCVDNAIFASNTQPILIFNE